MLWTLRLVLLATLATTVASAPKPQPIIMGAAQYAVRAVSIPSEGIPGPLPQPGADGSIGGYLRKNPDGSDVEIWTRRSEAISQPALAFTLKQTCAGEKYELHHGSEKLAYVLNSQEFNQHDSPFNLIPVDYPQTPGVYFSEWTVKKDYYGRTSLGLSTDVELGVEAGNKWIEATAVWNSDAGGVDYITDGHKIENCGSCYDDASCHTYECYGRHIVLELVPA